MSVTPSAGAHDDHGRRSRWVKITLAGLGATLHAFLIRNVGSPILVENIRVLGWGLLVLILLGGLSHGVKTWAWRFTFDCEHRTTPFFRMLGIRLAGEAVGQLSFGGPVLGETTRALLVRSSVPMVNGISSVALDRGMNAFTGVLLIVVGALLSPFRLGLSRTGQAYNAALALAFIGLAVLVVVAIRRRWPLLSGTLQALGRISAMNRLAESQRANVKKIETIIFSFYEERGGAFWFSFGLNLLGHAFGVLEIYLVLWFLGVQATLLAAFLIEVLTKVVKIAGTIIPGNLGVFEGGNMIILRALGLGSTTGLTLAIARRIRLLFWVGVGLMILLAHGLHLKPVAAVAKIEMNRPEEKQLGLEVTKQCPD